MRPRNPFQVSSLRAASLIVLCAITLIGCVTNETHTKALTELDAAKKTSAQRAAELDALKKQSQAQSDHPKQQLASLQQNLDQESTQRKTAEEAAAALEWPDSKCSPSAMPGPGRSLPMKPSRVEAPIDG